MLSIDYDILRLFSAHDRWTPATAAMQLGARLSYVRTRFASLLKKSLIYQVRTRWFSYYKITTEGEQCLSESRRNVALRDPHPWIRRVRAGIDSEGHELVLPGCAAIPRPEKPEMSYEMDVDAIIARVDAERHG
jgi:hypothetical protein